MAAEVLGLLVRGAGRGRRAALHLGIHRALVLHAGLAGRALLVGAGLRTRAGLGAGGRVVLLAGRLREGAGGGTDQHGDGGASGDKILEGHPVSSLRIWPKVFSARDETMPPQAKNNHRQEPRETRSS